MEAKLIFQYDRDADILYISKRHPYPEQESEEVSDGVIARLYDTQDHAADVRSGSAMEMLFGSRTRAKLPTLFLTRTGEDYYVREPRGGLDFRCGRFNTSWPGWSEWGWYRAAGEGARDFIRQMRTIRSTLT